MSTRSELDSALLLAMGGPDSLEAIPNYLYNIFSDRTLIQLPGGVLLQRPLAFLISRLRSSKVEAHYRLIGGSSPLLQRTETQARFIEDNLKKQNPGFRCYVGMRYYQPLISEVVSQMRSDGCRHTVVLPMYPQYSLATTGSSLREFSRVLGHASQIKWSLIKDFHQESGYIGLLRRYIERYTKADDILLFSAHSLPQKFLDDGDPYVDQVRQTSNLAANGREYFVSFQSRTGPVNWVGPDTIDECRQLLTTTKRRICLVPVSFVCDHIETLYELDIELPQKLGEIATERLYRLPMFNDDPEFGTMLAKLIVQGIPNHADV